MLNFNCLIRHNDFEPLIRLKITKKVRSENKCKYFDQQINRFVSLKSCNSLRLRTNACLKSAARNRNTRIPGCAWSNPVYKLCEIRGIFNLLSPNFTEMSRYFFVSCEFFFNRLLSRNWRMNCVK